MEHEVACIDITPLAVGKEHAELCSLGLWTDISVRVLKLPTLDIIHSQFLGGGECCAVMITEVSMLWVMYRDHPSINCHGTI